MEHPFDANKILIVDDNRSNVYAFQSILQAPDLELLAAASGEEALQILLDHPDVALVLMDVQMPGMDGFETTQLIRGQPRFRDIPILFISAVHRSDDFARLGFSLGASDYITKPVDSDVLESKVNVFLALQSQKRQLAREVAERQQAEARLAHLNAVLRAVREINQLIAGEKDRDRLLQAACDSLVETRNYHGAWIIAWDGDGEPHAYGESGWDGNPSRELDALRGAGRPACADNTPSQAQIVLPDVLPAGCALCPFAPRWRDHGGLAAPLWHDGQLYGCMALAVAPDAPVDGEELALLDEVAGDMALALHSLDQEESRRLAEEALCRSQEQYRDLYENAPNAYFSVSPDGLIHQCNRRAGEMLGYEPTALIGRPALDLYADTPEGKPAAARVLAAFRAGEPVSDQVLQMRRADGGPVWVSLSVNALRDKSGRILESRSVAVDVTDRVRAEEERGRLLRRVEAQARQIQQVIDTVPEGVILLDPSQQALLANPAGERDLATLAGAQVGDRISRLGSRLLVELLTSPPKGLWHEVQSGDRTFELIARPIENGATPQGWVLVVHEVTEERRIQRQVQQQERLAAVGQLAAGIAHDFNNIMAVIILQGQVGLKQPELPQTLHDRLTMMITQARRATDLIGQILDYSRSAVLERQTLDLLPLVKEQVKLLERTLPEHVEIHLNYERGDYLISAGPMRMQQVLMNLAMNARDAMPNGGQLDISLGHLKLDRAAAAPLTGMDPGEWIRLVVADQGAGIPADVLPHIFEPFFTTKPRGQGTGLGLAQVWGIVSQHGGYIDVSTELGQGTRFSVYLPALPAAEEPEVRPAELPVLAQGNGEKVLLVEDNASVRAAVAAALHALNYQVVPAADGREALQLLEASDADIALVLSDVVMPGMGGIALFHALRERGLATPVVVMTGHTMQRELEGLINEGLDAWIQKPPTLDKLAGVLARVLGK